MPKPTFQSYLSSHHIQKGQAFTHTRIGAKNPKIVGGTYEFTNLPTFWSNYYHHIFVDGNMEYLTEKQLIENGPIVVDIDLRYETSITTRQHTKDHIQDMIWMYMEKISATHKITDGAKVPIYILEKPNVNRLEEKTKDGIHMIIGIKMHRALQMILREHAVAELSNTWEDLPITNTWDNVLDEGVTKAHTNWQLFGSRKPQNEAYALKYYFTAEYNTDGDEWELTEEKVAGFLKPTTFPLLSAQYTEHQGFEMKDNIKEKFEINKKSLTAKKRKIILKQGQDSVPYDQIKNNTMLDAELARLFEDIAPTDYILQEVHNYTMTLPKQFWGEGSYDKWIRVGWALANTDKRLFLTWVKFSSQSKDFSWENIGEFYKDWRTLAPNGSGALTNRSIMYWSREEVPDKYRKIHFETVDYFIEQTIKTDNPTEVDLANVLYQLYKDEFVCISIKNNVWYEFKGHRWFEIDSGTTLRWLISKTMHDIYVKKIQQQMETIQVIDQADKNYELIRKRGHKLTIIGEVLKKTTWKNNIMREARELFYDKDFVQNLDNNPYLLCCNNCVIDIKNKESRRGRPDDYISKSTLIDFKPFSQEKYGDTMREIIDFMEQLFPVEELRNYMWEHLASCLVGTCDNQTFTIYTGDGRNGKSKLVDLMGKVLGEYKGTVPITLVTQKRTSIGGTSSEIVQLMGCRMAVMQEPTKGMKLNEGIMKEITAGDPLQGRALFRDTVTFVPQFKLVVCTNVLFDINSNDDGTWRRIRKVDYMAKFLEKPYEEEVQFPKTEYPYQFKVDKKLDYKFDRWAPVMLALLVEKAYVCQGIVTDCPMVMSSSDEYRDSQDYLAEFVKENIERKTGGRIKKMELMTHFSDWYRSNYGRGAPKGKEIYNFIDKKFGLIRADGWRNIAIIYSGNSDDEGDDDDGEC